MKIFASLPLLVMFLLLPHFSLAKNSCITVFEPKPHKVHSEYRTLSDLLNRRESASWTLLLESPTGYISSYLSHLRKHPEWESIEPQIMRLLFSRFEFRVIYPGSYDVSRQRLEIELFKIAAENREVLPMEWIDILWDSTKNRDLGLQILQLMFRIREQKNDQLVGFKNSWEVLSEGAGHGKKPGIDWSKRIADESQSSTIRSLTRFLLLAPSNPLRNISMDPQLFSKSNRKQFEKFLDLSSSILTLFPDKSASWDMIRNGLELQTRGISPSRLEELNNTLEAIRLDEFESLIKKDFPDFSVSSGQYESFSQRMLNEDPYVTTFSRLLSVADWRSTAPALVKILEKELNDDFFKFKFLGDSENPADQKMARRQLDGLTMEQVRSWTRKRITYSLVEKPGTINQSQVSLSMTEGRRYLKNLFALLQPTRSQTLLPEQQKKIYQIVIHRFGSRPPAIILSEIMDLKPKNETIESFHRNIIRSVANEIVNDTHPINAKNSLAFIRNILKHLQVDPQFQDAIRIAGLLFKKVSDPWMNKSLIVTATSWESRFLLTLGEEAGICNSCLSYKNGGSIRGLIGLAMDANTQGLVSYQLKTQHFRSKMDFQQVLQAAHRHELSIVFNGNRSTMDFYIGEKIISSLPLGQGHLRRFIHYGLTAERAPGLAFDSTVDAKHFALPTMQQQANHLLKSMAKAMGANTESQIFIPPSRNLEGGVFSQNPYGEHKEERHITPN